MAVSFQRATALTISKEMLPTAKMGDNGLLLRETSMILFATILMLSAADQRFLKEDWPCASNLIKKNYSRPIKVDDLASRIADECTPPFKPEIEAHNDSDRAFEKLREASYGLDKAIFANEILTDIRRLRRVKAIRLVH